MKTKPKSLTLSGLKKSGFKKTQILFAALAFLSSCGENFLKSLSTKTSDEAYIESAIKSLDSKDYDTAITYLTSKLSASRQTGDDIRRLTAQAYAGKCGLDTLTYLTILGSSGVSALFKIFYTPLVGTVVNPTYCKLATAKMVEIGGITARTSSDNTFLTFLSMARIGATIQSSLDTSPTGGDGTMESTSCSMTDAQVDEVILGLGYTIENIGSVTASLLGGNSSTSLNTLITQCTSLGVTCSITDPSLITTALRDTFRDLLNTVEYGVGTVVTSGNALLIVAACP